MHPFRNRKRKNMTDQMGPKYGQSNGPTLFGPTSVEWLALFNGTYDGRSSVPMIGVQRYLWCLFFQRYLRYALTGLMMGVQWYDWYARNGTSDDRSTVRLVDVRCVAGPNLTSISHFNSAAIFIQRLFQVVFPWSKGYLADPLVVVVAFVAADVAVVPPPLFPR